MDIRMMFLTIPMDNDVAITFGYTVFLFKLLDVKIFIVMDLVLFNFYYAHYLIVLYAHKFCLINALIQISKMIILAVLSHP